MKITGIDLAKTNFYLFSINAYGKPTGKIKLSRSNLLSWPVQQPSMTIAMEARGALHHWQGRYKSSVIKRFSSITKKIRYGGERCLSSGLKITRVDDEE